MSIICLSPYFSNIHGGRFEQNGEWGSAGCIDLMEGDISFFDDVRKENPGGDADVDVDYTGKKVKPAKKCKSQPQIKYVIQKTPLRYALYVYLFFIMILIVIFNFIAYFQALKCVRSITGRDSQIHWKGFAFSATYIFSVKFESPDGPESNLYWYAYPFGKIEIFQ